MDSTIQRRTWLRQAALSIAGITIAPTLLRAVEEPIPADVIIRLHANENPYGPSLPARKAMSNAITASNRYPWELTSSLRDKIAAAYGLTKDNVLIGAGSSEILGLVAQLAALQKGNAITADPTFGIWINAGERYGLQIIKVPLNIKKEHDLARMKEAINSDTKLVYVCNPNNPTGTVVSPNELRQFIKGVPGSAIVLLDEAYTEYSDEPSLTEMVDSIPNLVIAKTFSKIYGLAGARIGYAIANPALIKKLNDLQPWSNAGASAVSLAAAFASYGDKQFIAESKSKNATARRLVANELQRLQIPFIPSHTNFLYLSVKDQKHDLAALLASNNIRAGRVNDDPDKWTRISIGTTEQMNKYLQYVRQCYNA